MAFLTETSFKNYFDKPKAELFYTSIRCGLHHQSEKQLAIPESNEEAEDRWSRIPWMAKASSSTSTNFTSYSSRSCPNTRIQFANPRIPMCEMHSERR